MNFHGGKERRDLGKGLEVLNDILKNCSSMCMQIK